MWRSRHSASSPWRLRCRVARLHVLTLRDHLRQVLVAPALVALGVDAELLHVHPLALAGRVVHQGHQPHGRIVQKRRRYLEHVVARQLAADVQEVLGPQQPLAARMAQGVHGVLEALCAHRAFVEIAHAHGVEHRRDARGRHLRVVGEQGRHGRPAHAGARLQVLLEVVGVQLDQSRDQVVAVPVLRAGRGAAARLQIDDHPIAHRYGRHGDLVGRDDPGVGDDPVCGVLMPDMITLLPRSNEPPLRHLLRAVRGLAAVAYRQPVAGTRRRARTSPLAQPAVPGL